MDSRWIPGGPCLDRSSIRSVSVARPREAARGGARTLTGSITRALAGLQEAVTVEVLLYVLFTVVALATRFWDLGSRALHHDESLHAYFSWLYSEGRGYTHDPMMHGPLLFHMTAAVYKLFGDSDFTARIAPAVFGTILVPLPYLLRRQLGRVSMLVASFLLLISPGMWYYGRFARNEAWCLVFTLLIFVGLVRWMDSRQSRWLHLAWINWVLLFCSKEISFIVLFTFVTFLFGALLLAHSKKSLFWLFAFPAGMVLLIKVLPPILGWAALPEIPFDKPSMEKSLAYARGMLTSPQVILGIVWFVAWLAILVYFLMRDRVLGQLRDLRDGVTTGNALSTAIASMHRFWLQVGLLVLEFVIIAVPLYTSLFTNFPGGLYSGSFGGLFYWLAQQEEERGLQPWYYYSVLNPVYEPVAVLLGLAGLVFGAFWLLRRWRWASDVPSVFRMSYAMMMYWFVMSYLIYSWAGEKMPWLSVHITLPLIFLGAVWGTRALGLEGGWKPKWSARRPGVRVFVALAALIVGWIVYRMAGWSLQTDPAGQSPLVYGLLALGLLGVAAAYWLGPRAAGRAFGLLIIALLTVYTIQTALQLSYYNGDVPVEQMVYVQTTPRVPNVMGAISRVSNETAGGLNAPIIYDSEVSWPFVWYLRDFKKARYMPKGPDSVPAGDVQFVVVGAGNEAKVKPYMNNYTTYRYPMRWWFPEEMYRKLVPTAEVQGAGLLRGTYVQAKHVLAGIADWRKPERQATLWRYFMYRRPDGILNSTDMVLYVRNDLVGKFNAGRF